MIKSFKHRGLAELFELGQSRRVRPDNQSRCLRRLEALDQAESLTDLQIPGFNFHGLQGTPGDSVSTQTGHGASPSSGKKGKRYGLTWLNTIEGLIMKEYSVKRPLGRLPIHPGEILRKDVLPALGLSVSEAARRLGISRQQLHRVLAGTHPITTEMALRIGKFAGNGPALWLRLQQAYDLWHTERRMKIELSKIEPVALVGT